MITIGSLFAGIGGLELGLERATGGRVVWQVEQEPFCREILAKHWPDADRSVTDVREAGPTLPWVDVICGGFPCQDLSVAGKGAGLEGARSGLWREFARIVSEIRPRAVVIENTGHAWRRWVPFVRADLWAVGYASVPFRVRAVDVGAPHQRSRVFVVAHANGIDGRARGPGGVDRGDSRHEGHTYRVDADVTDPDREPLRERAERRPGGRTRRVQGQRETEPRHDGGAWVASNADRIGRQKQHAPTESSRAGFDTGRARSFWSEGPPVSPVRRVDDGIPPGVDRARLRALGNAVVPQVAEVVGLELMDVLRA